MENTNRHRSATAPLECEWKQGKPAVARRLGYEEETGNELRRKVSQNAAVALNSSCPEFVVQQETEIFVPLPRIELPDPEGFYAGLVLRKIRAESQPGWELSEDEGSSQTWNTGGRPAAAQTSSEAARRGTSGEPIETLLVEMAQRHAQTPFIQETVFMNSAKIQSTHQERMAYVYVRQSAPHRVIEHRESTESQYHLRERAIGLGWTPGRVEIIDEAQGRSGSASSHRTGFQRLVSEVGVGKVGLVLMLEASRLARNNSDWYRLIEICGISGTLIGDETAVYSPRDPNDRLLLGVKGQYRTHGSRVRDKFVEGSAALERDSQ